MTTTTPTADDFLMGGGIPSAKFETIGDTITGTISEPPEVQQQRDFDDNELKFWDDGNPMLQLRVVLQTAERDAKIEDDDGRRAVYLKGQAQKEAQRAVRASGAKGLRVGGTFAMRFVSEEPNKRGRGNPKKVYSIAYEPPDPLAQVANSTPASTTQPAKAAPAAAPLLPPTSAAPDASAGPPPGIDPAVWAALDDAQKLAVAAASAKPPY